MDPMGKKKIEAKNKSKAILGRLGADENIVIDLNEWEQVIATEVCTFSKFHITYDLVASLIALLSHENNEYL